MPWQPRSASRKANLPGATNSTQLINFRLDQLLTQIRAGVYEGLEKTGKMAEAIAVKHAPVRKVFAEGRPQGGGVKKGERLLTDAEARAESKIRSQLGLGPGHGVKTMGRPGTRPGLPRGGQTFQVVPGEGRVGMPNGEQPYNTLFRQSQLYHPAVRLNMGNIADRREAAARYGFENQTLRYVARRGEASDFTVKLPRERRDDQRQVAQSDYSQAMGGRYLRGEEHRRQPTYRRQTANGRTVTETTGSLRVREHAEGLPHGALGRYDASVFGMDNAMTARGRYEAGITRSLGASHAGRAVMWAGNAASGRLQVGGRLKRGIKYIPPKRDGTVMTAWVDSPTYYTRYVEFGTRHAAAQPFLRPAVGEARELMRAYIKEAIARSVSGGKR